MLTYLLSSIIKITSASAVKGTLTVEEVQSSSSAVQYTACAGIMWPMSYHPVVIGAQETGPKIILR